MAPAQEVRKLVFQGFDLWPSDKTSAVQHRLFGIFEFKTVFFALSGEVYEGNHASKVRIF